jgi:curved DNA-binding protein CbpA
MINGRTFYQILNVLPDAEDIVIRAAYKALSQKYHPDRCTEDQKIANERMALINLAYDTLSDLEKKKKYDADLNESQSANVYSDDPKEDIFKDFYIQTSSDWELAREYFPKIEQQFQHLRKINQGLAFAFREILLEKKCFEDSHLFFEGCKQSFLERYFGNQKEILQFAEMLITSNFRDAALELNKTIKVLGEIKSPEKIIRKIQEKFPSMHRKITRNTLYEHIGLLDTKKVKDFDCIFFTNGECGIISGSTVRIYDSETNMNNSINNFRAQNMFSKTGLLEVVNL